MRIQTLLLALFLSFAPSACTTAKPPVSVPGAQLTQRQQIYQETLNYIQTTDKWKAAIMEAAGTAVRINLITAEQGASIRAKGVAADALVRKALDALEVYVKVTDADPFAGQFDVQKQIAVATTAITEIAALLTEWKVLK